MASSFCSRLALCAALAGVISAPAVRAFAQPGGVGKPAALTTEQARKLRPLFNEFRKAETPPAKRAELFAGMMDLGPAAAPDVLAYVDRELHDRRQAYCRLLAAYLPKAYLAKLVALSDEQILQIQSTRRLWRDYILGEGGRVDFREVFLKPVNEIAAYLLPDLDAIGDATLAAQRKGLLEFAEYQAKCHAALGIDIDPTKRLVSPTGIPYPPLDQPPTFQDKLSYLERTLVLMYSVAPPAARPVLLKNAELARQVDVQEAEFVMYGNQVRMIVGSVAWVIDPLITACTRDHSADRKAGKASGHSSTVPGKEGFTKRLKRFGARGSSEGAGGGRDGKGYIWQLSYGGGHTGPLYRLRRNVVGPGRRGGVYTSVYATDKKLLHPCQATTGELFMPPGVMRADVRAPALRRIYTALRNRQFAAAAALTATAKVSGDVNQMLLRFFKAAVQAELDWTIQVLTALDAAGDVYELKRAVVAARGMFGRMPAFVEKVAPFEQRLAKPETAGEIRAGLMFRQILARSYNAASLKRFVASFPKSAYSEAAEWNLQKDLGAGLKGFDPLGYFLDKSKVLHNYGYPWETR